VAYPIFAITGFLTCLNFVIIATDAGKEKRLPGIPAIRGRVCQQALKNRREPILEPGFSDCSYGYRPGRRTGRTEPKETLNNFDTVAVWIAQSLFFT